jgi:uncharacterized protein
MENNILELKKKILPILKKHDVVKAGFFGSFARQNDFNKKSDIDLLIQYSKEKSLYEFVGLKIDLEDNIGFKFDIVTYDSVHDLLKKQILKDEVRIL